MVENELIRSEEKLFLSFDTVFLVPIVSILMIYQEVTFLTFVT